MNINELGDSFKWWVGQVVSRDDPLQNGRIKVRIFNDHGSPENIPDDDLPWCMVMMPINKASTLAEGGNAIGSSATGIINGSVVIGFYADGSEKQIPVAMGTIVGAPLGIVTDASPQTSPTDMPFEARGIKSTRDFNFGEIGGFEPIGPLLGAQQAIYPYNKVEVTESGHLQEMDDTPGKERIYTRHRIGSYSYMGYDGDVANKTMNNNWEIIGNNKLQFVNANVIRTVNGCYVVSAKGPVMVQTDDSISLQAGRFVSISAGYAMTLSAPIILLN